MPYICPFFLSFHVSVTIPSDGDKTVYLMDVYSYTHRVAQGSQPKVFDKHCLPLAAQPETSPWRDLETKTATLGLIHTMIVLDGLLT